LVIILPGIEGESSLNHDIRQGLADGGMNCGLPIYNWGSPVPGLGMVFNQMDVTGNRIEGAKIAKMIVEYQDSYPGKPVHVIGHSGGGGVAVFAAEAMPPGRMIDGLVLLSASISADYDLTKAIGNCRKGILNVYNTNDTAVLVVGTMMVGTMDGERGASAGATGFDRSFQGLYQLSVDSDASPHFSTARPDFVSGRIARWVAALNWPAGG
jgi:pimeloyl-ACP methyl ester carboxylesterase